MASWSYFAGIDWASRTHALCVIDATGRVVLRLDVAHTQEGIERIVRQLKSFKGLVIAIERPSGVLVDVLSDAGLCVVPIHPNILKASRARYRGAFFHPTGELGRQKVLGSVESEQSQLRFDDGVDGLGRQPRPFAQRQTHVFAHGE